MKIIIRKFVMVAMAITILFTNVNMVEASELKADNTSAYEQKTGMESRTTKTYSFGRSKIVIHDRNYFKNVIFSIYN